jgi:dynein heavy chain
MHELGEKYPVLYEESMNTVLPQEVAKYNRLTNLMREMLVNVQRALIGEVVMSEDLEAMSEALFNN